MLVNKKSLQANQGKELIILFVWTQDNLITVYTKHNKAGEK